VKASVVHISKNIEFGLMAILVALIASSFAHVPVWCDHR